MNLNVDTIWYTRYRSTSNVDFGEAAPTQLLTIKNQPAIPRNNNPRIKGNTTLFTNIMQP
jgi:hypothetical protein